MAYQFISDLREKICMSGLLRPEFFNISFFLAVTYIDLVVLAGVIYSYIDAFSQIAPQRFLDNHVSTAIFTSTTLASVS